MAIVAIVAIGTVASPPQPHIRENLFHSYFVRTNSFRGITPDLRESSNKKQRPARQFRLTGVVKVQVVIAPDGQVKDVKVLGGHPVLVSAVQDTLKNWKYAPASSETTVTMVFNFHP